MNEPASKRPFGHLRTLSDPLASAWQILAVALVVGVLAGLLRVPRSLAVDLPLSIRWTAAASGVCLALLLDWLDRRLGLMNAVTPHLKLACLGTVAISGVLFYVLRARLHWGDSAMLVGSLEAGVHRWNPRWLTGMIGLAYAYDPLRAVLPATLFVTLVYIGLGCAGLLLLASTLDTIAEKRPVPLRVMLLVLASPATLLLFSGYLEIYAVPQFGVILFLWASARMSFGHGRLGFGAFGLVTGFASLLYIGNLLLPAFGAMLSLARLSATQPLDPRLAVRQLGRFTLGLAAAAYGSLCFVRGELILDAGRLVRALPWMLDVATDVLRTEATGASLRSVVPDALSLTRARQWLETWSLYGYFGLMLAVAVLVLCVTDGSLRRALLAECRRGYLPILVGLAAVYLTVSYFKRPVMGFRDWDLFLYAAYPVNLIGAYLWLRLGSQAAAVGRMGAVFAVCAAAWGAMAYAYVNPLRPEWDALPGRRHVSAFETYDVMQRVAAPDLAAAGEATFLP